MINQKILVLSPTPSHPVDFGNRKRIYSVCKTLKEMGHEVHFVLYPLENDWRRDFPKEEKIQMEHEWDSLHVVIPTVEYHMPPQGKADHGIDDWWDPALGSFLNWLFEAESFDIFYINYTYLSKAFVHAPHSTLKILDTHDKFSGRRQLLEKLGIAPEFFHTTEEEEIKAFDRSDLVLAIKEEEEKIFGDLIGDPDKVMTLTHSDLLFKQVVPKESSEYLRIGFIGGRNNINKQNFTRFLEIALPQFEAFFAPIKLVIAGSVCKDFENLRVHPHVELLGYLDSVEEFYSHIDACIIPMDISSGQKIKTAEAFAFGAPLIAHAHAMEGYKGTHRLQMLNSYEEMAQACIKLSFDRTELEDLRMASQRGFKLQLDKFESALSKVISAGTKLIPIQLFIVDHKWIQDPLLKYHIASQLLLTKGMNKTILITDGPVANKDRDDLEKLCYLKTSTKKDFQEFVESVYEHHRVNFTWLYHESIDTSSFQNIVVLPSFIKSNKLKTKDKATTNQMIKELEFHTGYIHNNEFKTLKNIATVGFDGYLKKVSSQLEEDYEKNKAVIIYCDNKAVQLAEKTEAFIDNAFTKNYNIVINPKKLFHRVYAVINFSSSPNLQLNYYRQKLKPILSIYDFESYFDLLREIYTLLDSQDKRDDQVKLQEKLFFNQPGISHFYNHLDKISIFK